MMELSNPNVCFFIPNPTLVSCYSRVDCTFFLKTKNHLKIKQRELQICSIFFIKRKSMFRKQFFSAKGSQKRNFFTNCNVVEVLKN